MKEYEIKKEGVLRNAKDLIEQQRKVFNLQEPILDILGDINQLQKEFFDQDEKDSEYNIMSEVAEFKNNYLDQMSGKKGRAKK